MQAAVKFEEFTESRKSVRDPSDTAATLRQLKQPTETIRLTDISPTGCGFTSRWPMVPGTRAWLSLPGLESWAATVVWFEGGRGGLAFERPLHPLVAARFAAESGGEARPGSSG